MSESDLNLSHCKSLAAYNCSREVVSRPLQHTQVPLKADTKYVVVSFCLTHKTILSMLKALKNNILSPHLTFR